MITGRSEPILKFWGTLTPVGSLGQYTASVNRYEPGQHGALQYHVQKHEKHLVIEGSGCVWEGRDGVLHGEVLEPGMTIDIPPGVVHMIQAGQEGLTLVELSFTPVSDDRVNVEDEYKNAIG